MPTSDSVVSVGAANEISRREAYENTERTGRLSVLPAKLAHRGNNTEAEKGMEKAVTAVGAGAIDSREALIEAVATGSGRNPELRGHQPLPDGRIGAGCLSQWWPSPFTVENVTYRAPEHWMMAAKARIFADPGGGTRNLAAEHPADAKKERPPGPALRRGDLAARAVPCRRRGQHAQVRRPRGPARLPAEHGRPRPGRGDRVWGIGLGAKNERASDPAQWRGANLLGFALMQARTRLREAGAGTDS
ncbi:NADAR family protein [Streptomyces hirsutus]